MAKKQKPSNWYRLDNAGVLYSALKKEKYAPVYRFSAVMTDPVDPEALQQAVNRIMPRFPCFQVRIRKGVFWCYFEPNCKPGPFVQPDISNPCQPIRDKTDNDWLIRFYYYERRISFEAFHAISDGAGALIFFRTVLAEYLRQRGVEIPPDPSILDIAEQPRPQELEDAYSRYAGKRVLRGGMQKTAYTNTSSPEPFYSLNVTMGLMPVDILKAKSKTYGANINEYLTAVLMLSLLEKQRAERPIRERPISLAVPVNLRSWFPSETLRNFLLTLRPCIDPTLGEYTLEDIIRYVHHYMGQHLSPAGNAGHTNRQCPVYPESLSANHTAISKKTCHGLFLLAGGRTALYRHLHQSRRFPCTPRHGAAHSAHGGDSRAGHPPLSPLCRHQLRQHAGGDLCRHRTFQRNRAAVLYPFGPRGGPRQGDFNRTR